MWMHEIKMWQLVPVILFITYGEAQYQYQRPNYIQGGYNNRPPYHLGQNPYNYNVQPSPLPVNPYVPAKQYPEDPYYPYRPLVNPYGSYLRQSQSQSKSRTDPFANEGHPFEVEYNSNDGDADSEVQSYSEDLELVENFGNYLKKRTHLEGSSPSNDAAHQYNALLSVLVALARVVRNSCADFDQVYDQIYPSTVETYYKYGLANADKVAVMIDDYIRKGNSHIPKIRKLKQDICETELFCSVIVDNKVRSSPLLYVKELETLEALAHMARSYYPYIQEFNQAAQKGNVLYYLQNSKDRIREYIMHIINSVEHLADGPVICP